MKVSFITAAMVLIAVEARCQGTVNFANGAAGVNAPVTTAPGATPVAGPDWQAELWMLETNGNWLRVSQPVPFLAQAVAGYVLGGLVTVPVEAGQQATFRVRAFNTNSALEGISQPVAVTLGGGKMPPVNLVGLQGWSIVGPPQLRISLSDNQAAVSWPTGFPSFVLESSDNLTRTDWSVVGETPTTNGTQITVTVPVDSTDKFYRLRSN